MGMLFEFATRLSRSPIHAPLRWVAGQLARYADIADNLNNGDAASNGEAFLVRQGAPHWSVAFDVGANVGDWTLAVRAANPACTVHAFEASPSTFTLLRAHVGGDPGVVLHAAGAGDADGEIEFHDHGIGSGLSSFVSRDTIQSLSEGTLVRVEARRLDGVREELGLERVDFVKIDTEGYEIPVLQGLRGALAEKRVDCVQFEYGGTWLDAGRRLIDAHRLFEAHGYRIYRLMPAGVARVGYDPMRDEHYKYANYVATHDEAVFARWGVPCA